MHVVIRGIDFGWMYEDEYKSFKSFHNALFPLSDAGAALLHNKMLNRADSKEETTIGFWGTTSSGKTWLLNAFLRQILLMMTDTNLAFKLWKENDISREKILSLLDDMNLFDEYKLFQNGKYLQPTSRKEEGYYYILRGEHNGKRFLPGVNSHFHKIFVTDEQGRIFASDPKSDDSCTRRESVASRDFIVVALDVESTGEKRSRTDADIVEMITSVRRLGSLIKISRKPKKISFCLTKSDEFGDFFAYHTRKDGGIFSEKSFVLNLLLQRFGNARGNELLEVLEEIESLRNVASRYFAVSSCGYLDGEINIEINASSKVARPKDPDLWSPVNVENVFLWHLDKIEKDRIAPKVSFVPDSRIKPIQEFLAKTDKMMYSKREKYIPYPVKNK